MLVDLDRVIVAVDDLPTAAADYARLLGCEPSRPGPSSQHSSGKDSSSKEDESSRKEDESRVWFGLGNTTLELSARTELALPDGAPKREGVAAIVFREDEREADSWLPAASTRGIPIGLSRDERDAAGVRAESSRSSSVSALDSAVSGLDHVVISTGDLDAARKLYGQELELRLALDRPFDKRGIQILFFRISGVTIEVVGPLPGAAEREGGPGAFAGNVDRFGGLAFRVDDLRAIRSRLAAAGFDVSEDRVGHKAGTRVCTVRSPTHGVPTLLIGPDRG